VSRYVPRFEREKELKRKKYQRHLVNTGGALAVGAGLARTPGAAKTLSRGSKTLRNSKGVQRFAGQAEKWTPRSNTLAATAGTVGALSSLNWGRQLKSEVQREEQKLGIKKNSAGVTPRQRFPGGSAEGRRMTEDDVVVKGALTAKDREKMWPNYKRGSSGAMSEGRHAAASAGYGVYGGLTGAAAGGFGAQALGRAPKKAAIAGGVIGGGVHAALRATPGARYKAERNRELRRAIKASQRTGGRPVMMHPARAHKTLAQAKAGRERFNATNRAPARLIKKPPGYGPGFQYGDIDMHVKKKMSQQEKDELGRKIGAATNTAGAIAGPAALYGAVKSRKEGGVPRGLTRDFGNSARGKKWMPKTAARARKAADYLDSPKSKLARRSAKVAAGTAVGLQAANWAGDAIAARTLSKEPQKPVAKRDVFDVAKASLRPDIQESLDNARQTINDANKTVNQAKTQVPQVRRGTGTPGTTPMPVSRAAWDAFNRTPPARPGTVKPKKLGRGKLMLAGGLGAAALGGGAYALNRRRNNVSKIRMPFGNVKSSDMDFLGDKAFSWADKPGQNVVAPATDVKGKPVTPPAAPKPVTPAAPSPAPAAPKPAAKPKKFKFPGGKKGALIAGGVGALTGGALLANRNVNKREAPVSARANELSRGKGTDWRGHVSPGARQAHDEVLPQHVRSSKLQRNLGIGATGLGAAGVVGGAKAFRRAKGLPGSVGSAALLGAGWGMGVSGIAHTGAGHNRLKANRERQRKIRARGWERREASLEKMSKLAMPKPPKPPGPMMPKKTPGMQQRGFVRTGGVKKNPSGSFSSFNGSTR
jgi:hypothetical protein